MLADFTTFRIGGPATSLTVTPSTRDSVAAALEAAPSTFVLGSGSNVLASDAGCEEPVLHLSGPSICRRLDAVTVEVSADVELATVVQLACDAGLSGLEHLAGIPGTVGGALAQNAGAYAHSIEDRVVSVDAVDRRSGRASSLARDECGFGYRASRFKDSELVVTGCVLELVAAEVVEVTADEIRGELTKAGHADHARVPVQLVRDVVMGVRGPKDHLVDDDNPTAGSFFKNLHLDPTSARYEEIEARFSARGAQLRSQGSTWFKEKWTAGRRTKDGRPTGEILAGALISSSAPDSDPNRFGIGAEIGRLRLGKGSPNTIVNKRGGTAREVLALAREMRDAVWEAYAVELELEVVLLGTDLAL